jgi:hypothetical protein
VPSLFPSFYSLEYTLADDGPHKITLNDIYFYEINVHVYDNSIYYGNETTLKAIATAGTVLTFRNGNLKDIMIKNVVAGNNGRVVVTGTIAEPKTKKVLEGN